VLVALELRLVEWDWKEGFSHGATRPMSMLLLCRFIVL
jgi:hypothetical protein